jgi:DNA segregation ATPase FtsK/SpoIIIE, S-DNA-T family
VIAIESDREFGLSVLRRLDKELARRGELFRQARVQDLASYRKTHPPENLPRTLLIIDEFQEFFTEDDGVGQDAALLLDRIVRQGRAFGIHVILGSQTLGGTYTLAKSTPGQMAVRIALQCNEADSYLILSDDNAAARLLSRPGEAIYNDMSGQIEGNNPFQTVFMPKDAQDGCLHRVEEKARKENQLASPPTVVFEGNNLAELRNNPLLRDLMTKGPSPDEPVRVWLGEANAIKGPTEVEFSRQAGRNLLIVGQNNDAGLAMYCSTLLSLAARYPPDGVRLCVFDGTPPESGARERLGAVAAALPHSVEFIEYRQVPEVVTDLANQLKNRREGGDTSGKPCYLLILGLQRFRMLRQEDDYSFSSSGEAKPVSPAQGFADLLTEGPGEGFHTIVWCDTLGNLNRAFNRKTLREFELRALFQMSASDSSELIDSPVANKLGLYNALLFTVQDGAIEKFRPYAPPEADLIEEFSRSLRARFPAARASAK